MWPCFLALLALQSPPFFCKRLLSYCTQSQSIGWLFWWGNVFLWRQQLIKQNVQIISDLGKLGSNLCAKLQAPPKCWAQGSLIDSSTCIQTIGHLQHLQHTKVCFSLNVTSSFLSGDPSIWLASESLCLCSLMSDHSLALLSGLLCSAFLRNRVASLWCSLTT